MSHTNRPFFPSLKISLWPLHLVEVIQIEGEGKRSAPPAVCPALILNWWKGVYWQNWQELWPPFYSSICQAPTLQPAATIECVDCSWVLCMGPRWSPSAPSRRSNANIFSLRIFSCAFFCVLIIVGFFRDPAGCFFSENNIFSFYLETTWPFFCFFVGPLQPVTIRPVFKRTPPKNSWITTCMSMKGLSMC